ncbi:hypothetical protein [Bacillus sp. V3-13]|uniref:hypothetical protein n=1 Tax=Bacillus sp. V3-13 TaxID=2053728 RepID=UPI0021525479|nr:hypothetical protein [Bacillus sp. V3-13]
MDDGIPCEPPSGYDRTKINNSPEQVQFNQDQQDRANGEKEGSAKGLEDGYQEAASNSIAGRGSIAYQEGYSAGYTKGYEEGKKKIEAEKTAATNEGYLLGQKQNDIAVPANYSSHAGLKKAFEDGFNKAVAERVEVKKKEFIELGYTDGKKDTHAPPNDVEEIYITAYEEGYEQAQSELKEEYFNQGYEAAFTMLEYKEPNLANEKFKEWYKEGFESNKEIVEIQNAGLALGQKGEELVIPAEYRKGELIFKEFYAMGFKEFEEKKTANQTASAGGLGAMVLIWLGRRFYVAKKMIS